MEGNITSGYFSWGPTFPVPLLQVLELRRPMDSRLEHVDFECLFTCLSVRQLIRIFASLLLERRVIFVADKLRWGPAGQGRRGRSDHTPSDQLIPQTPLCATYEVELVCGVGVRLHMCGKIKPV